MKKLITGYYVNKRFAVIAIFLLFTFQSFSQQIKPTKSGYAPVNGIKMYYEMYLPAGQAGGEGKPIVLLAATLSRQC